MKKILLLILLGFIFTGCENLTKEEIYQCKSVCSSMGRQFLGGYKESNGTLQCQCSTW